MKKMKSGQRSRPFHKTHSEKIKSHDPSKLKIKILGGLGEIGMNCMALEYDHEIIIIDCGLQFTDLEPYGVEFLIPNFSYLVENKDKIKAFVITHGHEDHIGALPYLFKMGIDAPIFSTPFTRSLIRKKLEELGIDSRNLLKEIGEGVLDDAFLDDAEPVEEDADVGTFAEDDEDDDLNFNGFGGDDNY